MQPRFERCPATTILSPTKMIVVGQSRVVRRYKAVQAT